MGSRLFLGAAAMLLSFALPAASIAADADAGVHAKKHHSYRYDQERRQVGGHRYWYQWQSFPYTPQNNAPGHYNNDSFWDRVQTQRNYPIGY
jgi:hypothetical protein